jgi:Asp-tRNA(Asn)/Glu-tRNA(Gln) amidotransferase B subunit
MDMNELSGDITSTPEQLAMIGNLVSYLQEMKARAEVQERALKKLLAEIRKIEEVDLPDALSEANLSAITTPSGWQVAIKRKLYASVPKKNIPFVSKWLKDHGHGSLVKPQVTIPFSQGEQEQLAALTDLLTANGISAYSVNEIINTGSLKSLVNELTEQGSDDIPLKEMGAHWLTRAEISKP